MEARVWRAGLALFLIFGRVVARVSAADVCPRVSLAGSIIGFRDTCRSSDTSLIVRLGVTEGDEETLQNALNLVHKNRDAYVALLFYASWCPFSKTCRPNFNDMSSLFPTIRHFAFEESVIRPSILSSDVTGIKPTSLNQSFLEKIVSPSNDWIPKEEGVELENCPFSWARSPEKLLQQDTYLALAASFVLIRLLYFLLPKIIACFKRAWMRHIRHASLTSLWDYSQAYLEQAKQVLFNMLNPCKQSNLQEGAKNAKAWASKSLASVSIGEPSSGRVHGGGSER